ncbi:MAG: restriction endonuclease [Thermoplasmata archaeon]
MTPEWPDAAAFEREVLVPLCEALNGALRRGVRYTTSAAFEKAVREALQPIVAPYGVKVDFDPHPYAFPDIVLGAYGIEVKFTVNDTWRSVANSVFESTRSPSVRQIYVVFGKLGGEPEVGWGRYEDCVIHVRTSHVPRFELEMSMPGRPRSRDSLFVQMRLPYDKFIQLSIEERMQHVRDYARGRLKPGEHLWWMGDRPDEAHVLPLGVRLYTGLEQDEKRRLRAEAALLCPQVVKPSRSKGKYDDATMYLLTYHGVLCSQARDLFSAGSVALRSDARRGGVYIMRALVDIQEEMRTAAQTLEDALFVEYWGASVPPEERIREWLRRADGFARDWTPSEVLFA